MSQGNSCRLVLSVLVLLLCAATAWAEIGSPIGVSPGGDQALSEVELRCPTFSWGGDADTARWELVVYRLEDGDAIPGVISDDARPVLAVELPGGARAWTPALGQCLEAGGRYAWAVRSAELGSLGKGATSSWSEPRLFKVVAAPSMADVRDAMAVLSAYLGSNSLEVRTGAERQGAPEKDRPTEDTGPQAPPVGGVTPSLGGAAAIRAIQSAVAGDASGFVGETSSADGAGAVLGNMAGGADLVLDGSADTETDTVVSQSGIDRSSASPESFDIGNSGAGNMTLTVDSLPVLTSATETLGGLSCANGQLAKWNGGLSQWECGDDLDTVYTAGNQLNLNVTQFDVVEGSGSGLDADLLDGLESTAFLASGTDDWVNVTGDTMTGTLTLNPAAGNAITTSNDIEMGTGSLLKAGTLFLHNQGSFNTGVGFGTLQNNTTGIGGTAVGTLALSSSTTGVYNTAVGGQALRFNTTGIKNTAVGNNTLRANTIGGANTSLGEGSMIANTEGSRNTAVGYLALFNNTTAPWNTAVGTFALLSNTIGDRNIAVGGVALRNNTEGARNISIGIDSMQRNTLGSRNVAVGSEALFYNQASDITAVGNQAMKANTSGTGNTALGALALYSNSTGYRNTAVGFEALRYNTSATNTATGYKALTSNTDGSSNTANGALALTANTTGGANVAVGANALLANSTGSNNTAVGTSALYASDGSDNTAVGTNALKANTTGDSNAAFGTGALYANISGSRNTASGANALASSTTAENNVAMGASALASTSTGSDNTAVGSYAMILNDSGFNNAAFGARALQANTSGVFNTAVGARAMYQNDTGYFNVALGYSALYRNLIGADNLALGHRAGSSTTGSSNILLNNYGVGGESNTLRIGLGTGTSYKDLDASYIQGIFGKMSTAGLAVYVNLSGKLGTTTSSKRFKEEVSGVDEFSDDLLSLRPVQFRFTEEHAGRADRPLEFGLIAEEVAEVLPDLVVYDDEGKPFTVRYHLLTPLLLNEIQRQQKVIATMNRRLEAIEGRANDGP